MKVEEAVLCVNCDEIFDGEENKACPKCAGKYCLYLKSILNRRATK